MARTGEDQSKAASATATAEQGKTTAAENADIGQFTANEGKLARGGEVGANPWLSATYLANQNRLNADVLNSNNSAGKQQLRSLNRRTGGFNTGATQSAITGLRLGTSRLGTQLNSQRANEDFGKNQQWQQYLAGMPLQAAGAEQQMYGTETGQLDAANRNLTQFGLASYGPWQSLAQGASGALAGALSKGGALSKSG